METARKPTGSFRKRSTRTGRQSSNARETPALLPLDIGKSTSKSSNFADVVTPKRSSSELILSDNNEELLKELLAEFRTTDKLQSHGLKSRNRLLFCGPPGCGKTITAEVVAKELKLDLLVVRIDSLVSSYLGETALNIRAIIEVAERQPCVLFFDEFDALARTRADSSAQGELRRVVNSLLLLIENFSGRGLLIAATNLEDTIDEALWRRFDEIMLFDLPGEDEIKEFLLLKTRNFKTSFLVEGQCQSLVGFSFAEIDQLCTQAIKYAVSGRRKRISKEDFDRSLANLRRRASIRQRLSTPSK